MELATFKPFEVYTGKNSGKKPICIKITPCCVYTPMLQVRVNNMLTYNRREPSFLASRPKEMSKEDFENFIVNWKPAPPFRHDVSKEPTYTGNITPHAQKRIKTAINLMLQAHPWQTIYNPVIGREMPFRLSFITLTIPHNDLVQPINGYKLLLKPLLEYFTKTLKVEEFVWKAELQSKSRYQLHYHIITPSFIEYWKIKDKWNYLLRKHNLLNNHENPNSIDIHGIYDVENLCAYLSKYLCKKILSEDGKEAPKLKGKIWDCSKNLRGKKYFTVEMTDANSQWLYRIDDTMHLTKINMPHCTIITHFKEGWPVDILTGCERLEYLNMLAS